MTPTQQQPCPQCGTAMPVSSRFCAHCGAASASTGFTNFTRVRQLFEEAQSIPPDRREAWLAHACQDNAALLQELRSMFLHPQTTFLEPRAPASPSIVPQSPPPAAEPSGNYLGPYRVVRELGRGGMGVVYLGTRDDGTFRKNVAIKLLLREQVNQEFLQRFKQERQVVAALDHPNVARILDGGDAPNGMPYYVMEYVEGLPLDQYCDRERVSLTGRIRLFQQVCHAVHYLHQNLILHRDLKPTNILVSSNGVVKLLDFGIAKMVGAASIGTQELTSAQSGTPLTPSYASPEQLQGATPQRTSDIYSMGVILYRLITGRQPYENLDEKFAKLASQQDPPLPSQNIRTDLRSTESTAQLRRATMGALDSIVLMAMRYDPKQRYQTAEDFALDLQRFLDGEALTAYREPVAVRSMKLIKRKRAAIAALAGIFVLGGFGAWQWERAEMQKAEVAHLQAQLGGVMDRVETHAAAETPGRPNPNDIEDVRELKKAFAANFAAAVAARPGISPERKALLNRAVHYLDRVRTTSSSDPELSVEIADAYEQLGGFEESAAGDRAAALSTYEKAAGLLSSLIAANPRSAMARDRLNRIKQRIASLGGSPMELAKTNETDDTRTPQTSAPKMASRSAVAPVRKVEQAAPPPSENAAPVEPVAPQQQPPEPPKLSAAEQRELETRATEVRIQMETAEQALEPQRQRLAALGDALNPDLTATISRMHAAYDRASRDMGEGNAAGVKENLTAASALAAKLMRAVGR